MPIKARHASAMRTTPSSLIVASEHGCICEDQQTIEPGVSVCRRMHAGSAAPVPCGSPENLAGSLNISKPGMLRERSLQLASMSSAPASSPLSKAPHVTVKGPTPPY